MPLLYALAILAIVAILSPRLSIALIIMTVVVRMIVPRQWPPEWQRRLDKFINGDDS